MEELSASVIESVKEAAGDDHKKAEEAIAGMRASLRQENERKIRELSGIFQFKDGEHEELIMQALKSTDWNVETAIGPLFQLVENHKNELERLNEEKVKAGRKIRARKEANIFLKELFDSVPEPRIQEILEENDGDVDATTEKLLKLVVEKDHKRSEETKDGKDGRDETPSPRQSAIPPVSLSVLFAEEDLRTMTKALKNSFPMLKEEELIAALKKHDLNIEKSTVDLVALDMARKQKDISNLCLRANVPPPPVVDTSSSAKDIAKNITQELEAKKSEDPKEIFKKKLEACFRNGPAPGVLAAPENTPSSSEKKMTLPTRAKIVQKRNPPGAVPKFVNPLHSSDVAAEADDDDEDSYDFIDTREIVHQLNSAALDATFTLSAEVLNLQAPKDQFPVKVQVKVTLTSQTLTDFPRPAWVGLYREGVPLESYTTYNWVSYGTKTESAPGTVSRLLEVSIPNSGAWEFSLFPSRAYDPVAGGSIVLAGKDEVNMRLEEKTLSVVCDIKSLNTATDRVWVGVYKVEEQNPRQYRRYKYLSSQNQSTVTFKAPIHTGTYEARLFAHNSYQVLARSAHYEINGI